MKDTDLQDNLQKEIDRVNKLCDAAFINPGRFGLCQDMRVSIHKAVRARDRSGVIDKINAVQELESYL